MDHKPRPSTPFRWILGGLFMTIVNGCWSLGLHMEDSQRKGQQRAFAPSPPLMPEWIFYTVYVLLFLQLVVSAVGVCDYGLVAGGWQ
jgi:hypothetical protein